MQTQKIQQHQINEHDHHTQSQQAAVEQPVVMMSAAPSNGAPLPPKRHNKRHQLSSTMTIPVPMQPPSESLTPLSPGLSRLSSTVRVKPVSSRQAREKAMAAASQQAKASNNNGKQYIAHCTHAQPPSPLRRGSALDHLEKAKGASPASSVGDAGDGPPEFEIEDATYNSDDSLG